METEVQVKIPKAFHARMENIVDGFIADIELCSHKMSEKEIVATQQFIKAIQNPIKKGKSIVYVFLNQLGLQRLINEANWWIEYESADYLGSADAVCYPVRNAAKHIVKALAA